MSKVLNIGYFLIRLAVKRLTCKHEYRQACKFFGHHKEGDMDVVFDIDYECVKCGRNLTVKMSEEWQLKNKDT